MGIWNAVCQPTLDDSFFLGYINSVVHHLTGGLLRRLHPALKSRILVLPLNSGKFNNTADMVEPVRKNSPELYIKMSLISTCCDLVRKG
jgi:hypothetical protein